MNFNSRYALLLALCMPILTFAQTTLTKEEAVKITLENNYGIRMARNSIRVAENNTSKENNGYLPTVDASAGPSASFGGSNQKFSSGMDASTQNAFSWSASASVAANYTLFNQQRDLTLGQLKEVLNLSNLELRQTMENTLLQLYSNYYQVAQLTENLSVLAENLNFSKQRQQRAQYRYDYGQGLRLDILNAEVDVNRDSIDYLNIQQQLANAKRNLNVIMGAPANNDFIADTSITYANGWSLSQLQVAANTNNINVLLLDKNRLISEMDLGIINAGRKPTIGANASYTYSFQDNASGSFINSSTNSGLNVGLTASWSIFDGGRRKTQKQNTRIAIESQLIQKEQIKQELNRDIQNAWETYQNGLFILQVERNSLATNQLNLERTEELFDAGQVTSVELRQAQLNLLNAELSYNTAKYNAKVVELELLQLSGRLLAENQ